MPSSHTIKVKEKVDKTPSVFAVSFTNGVLDVGKSSGQLKSTTYESQSNPNTRKLVLSVGEMDYVGNFDTKRKDAGRYVGVEDVDSGEISLIPLKRIRLRPTVSLAREGEEDEETTPAPAMTKQQQNDQLIESFGTAKQRQTVIRRQKHGIDKEMIHDALEAADVKTTNVSKTPAKNTNNEGESLIPPFNLEATEGDDAYPLDGYLPEKVYLSLVDTTDDFANAEMNDIQEWRQQQTYPELVLQELEKLPFAEEERQKSAVYIKFLFLLIKMYQLKPSEVKSKDPLQCNGLVIIPSVCNSHLLDTFTLKSGATRTMPARMKDKLMMVIMLICLRLNRYTMSERHILSALRVSSRKVSDVARALGCKVVKDKASNSVEGHTYLIINLKLPLTFPQSKPTPRRR